MGMGLRSLLMPLTSVKGAGQGGRSMSFSGKCAAVRFNAHNGYSGSWTCISNAKLLSFAFFAFCWVAAAVPTFDARGQFALNYFFFLKRALPCNCLMV